MKTTANPLRDAAGTLHRPAGGEARIVSLVPSITELVCELGLARQLVGRTGFCIHPRETVKRIPKVGGTKDVALDRVRELAPTHVIVNIDENEKPAADALSTFVPNVIVTHPLAPADNPALYRLIGGVFGAGQAAEALCRRFDEALAEAQAASSGFAPQRVLYLIWKDPWMSVSPETYISRMLALANWQTRPGRAEKRYPEIELTRELLDGVDAVLLSTEPFVFREKHVAELRAMPVMRGKAVALIDGEMTSWYGSRAIAGLAYLPGFRRALDAGR